VALLQVLSSMLPYEYSACFSTWYLCERHTHPNQTTGKAT
jgi:hypothetical protein